MKVAVSACCHCGPGSAIFSIPTKYERKKRALDLDVTRAFQTCCSLCCQCTALWGRKVAIPEH